MLKGASVKWRRCSSLTSPHTPSPQQSFRLQSLSPLGTCRWWWTTTRNDSHSLPGGKRNDTLVSYWFYTSVAQKRSCQPVSSTGTTQQVSPRCRAGSALWLNQKSSYWINTTGQNYNATSSGSFFGMLFLQNSIQASQPRSSCLVPSHSSREIFLKAQLQRKKKTLINAKPTL